MAYIRKVDFNADTPTNIRRIPYGTDWPVVYIIENGTDAYVGETVDAANRMSQHWQNPERRRLTEVSLISDDTFNKSVILDLEAYLIKHMFADGRYRLQNGNSGLHLHNYFNRTIYEKRFAEIWEQLIEREMAHKPVADLENSDLFKYSPYNALSSDQYTTVANIIVAMARRIREGKEMTAVVQGGPGTGKTILAVYLMKLLSERTIDTLTAEDDAEDGELDALQESLRLLPSNLKVGFVVPMQSLRTTLKGVFNSIRSLEPSMIISPSEVPKDNYDLLIVDEAHRLRQRKALAQYPAFDERNKMLGFGDEGTELDWILKCSKHQVFFYDGLQSVRPSDVDPARFQAILKKPGTTTYRLRTQFRCKGGDQYIDYCGRIMSMDPPANAEHFEGYDLQLFYNVEEMMAAIRRRDAEVGLCRTVAGYSWKWVTKKNPDLYDIDIQGHSYRWNSTDTDWVNSENALNEIGCIHTIQGYDLNYAGIIFGNEIDYNWITKELVVDAHEYYDQTGKSTIANDPEALRDYICNIYRTMLTRGIRGTYVFACKPGMRKYLAQYMPRYEGPVIRRGH